MENLGIEPRLKELVTDEEIEHAMAALALAPGPEPAWIMNYGASKHFTCNPHVFFYLGSVPQSSPCYLWEAKLMLFTVEVMLILNNLREK